jgi:hypothetical protein
VGRRDVSKLKTAPEKRTAELKHDHRTQMEVPHAFRKNWPKKKARINRDRRRAADAALQSVIKGADADSIVLPRRLLGEHLNKMGVQPLAVVVAKKRERLAAEFLPRYIEPRGDPGEHAERFTRFLEALVASRSGTARARAAHLLWLLDAPLPNNHGARYEQVWLKRFFRVHRALETRVREWCREHAGPASSARRRTMQ